MASFKNLTAKQLVKDYPVNTGFLIAYSGGADSSALLHLFSKPKELKEKVRAIHINHGLNPKADLWQRHCKKTCDDLGVHFKSIELNLEDASENSCRVARYQHFQAELNKKEILLTAHHNQDQAETVLMKLVRGSGIKGLAGIEKIKPFANGWIARPFLTFSPESLKQYLKKNDQTWIDDDSNQNNQYRRNHVRNIILPELQHHWPKAINNITRTAENLQNTSELLKFYTQYENSSLPVSKLIELPAKLRASLLYQWLTEKKLPLPSESAIQQITNDFIDAAADKSPMFENEYYQLHRWKSEIYCIKKAISISNNIEYRWDSSESLILPNGIGELIYHGDERQDFVVKFNQTGQKLKLPNQQITKSVKKLFQTHSIPIWERKRVPYIYCNQELVSIGYSWSNSESTNIEFIKYNQEL